MTPELKAKELVGKYKPYMYCYAGSGMLENSYDESVANDYAKKSTLIAVDEIIEENKNLAQNYVDDFRLLYWQQVKQAIEKM